MKIEIIEHWTDKDKPQVISYDKITEALARILGIYNNANMTARRDELLPKVELVLTMLEKK